MSLNLNQFVNHFCTVKGCIRRADVLPALILFADRKTRGAQMTLAHPVCKTCAGQITLEMVLTGALWLQIENAMLEQKLPPPVKALTKFAFVVIPRPKIIS